MIRGLRRIGAAAVLAVGLAVPAAAGDWLELETAHHRIYAPAQLRGFALAVSRAADRLTPGVSARYGFAPGGKTSWVLHDDAEWFNGAAYTLINHIELYGTTADFDLRGYSPWVSNVVAHEFAHLATLDRARRYPRWLGGLIFGAIDEHDEVKAGATWFLPPDRVPRWFSEGIAQYEAELQGSDRFDTTRAMLERMAWAEGELFSLGEMGSVADKSYVGGEQVYNQGYSWVRYLADRYGDRALDTLLANESDQLFAGFGRALEKTYGASLTDLEAGWRDAVAARGVSTIAALPWVYEGEEYYSSGPFDREPSLSPDGRWLAFLSDGDVDYPRRRLVIASVDRPDEQTRATERISGRAAWAPDGSYLVATKSHKILGQDREAYDLIKIDRTSGDTEWLTNGGTRMQWPAIHPGGTTLAAGIRGAGSWDLATLNPSAPERITIHTDLPWGWQIRELTFAPTGDLWGILARPGELDLARFSLTDPTRAQVLDWPGSEEHAPAIAPDGTVWFSSDRRGSFQLYTLAATDGTGALRTGALGGALGAAPGATATIATIYHHEDYRLHRLPATDPAHSHAVSGVTWRTVALPDRPPVTAVSNGFRRARFRLAPPLVYPEFQYLFGDASAGAVLILGDEMGHHGLQVEGIFGRTSDVNLAYSYSGLPPTLSLELSRYWSDLEVDLTDNAGNVTVLPVPFVWDSARTQALIDPFSDWIFGLSLTADRLRFTNYIPDQLRGITFGPDYDLVRRFDATGLAQWADAQPRSRNDIDFRGTIAYGSLSARHSREQIPDLAGNLSHVDRPHMRGVAEFSVARGTGRFTGEWGIRGGFIDRDVGNLDEFFLGGTVFSLRRGELRSFTNMPGYEDFSIAGEKLLHTHAAGRVMLATDMGAAGPFLFDALAAQVLVEAGNAWAHQASFGDIVDGVFGGNHFARGVRPTNDPRWATHPDFIGLLYDVAVDIRLKTILYDSMPWNSFVRVAHGFQDRTAFTDPNTRDIAVDQGGNPILRDPAARNALPVRIYIGIGTGF